MHSRDNGYRHMWLLSGTGEGPGLAEAFLLRDWKVSVSVVSQQAALAYSGLFLDNLWIGAVGGIAEIQEILKQGASFSERFDLVLDATASRAKSSHKSCFFLPVIQPLTA